MPPKYRHEQITDDLIERIRSGEFQPGSKLPSRRELTEHYSVSEPVIDRAFHTLKIMGLTESLIGVGVFVKERE